MCAPDVQDGLSVSALGRRMPTPERRPIGFTADLEDTP